MINGKHGQGTHSTKMSADKLAENTPNASKFISPNCLPKPKNLWFRWKKASLGVRSPCLQLQYYTRGSLFYSCKRIILLIYQWTSYYAIVLSLNLVGIQYARPAELGAITPHIFADLKAKPVRSSNFQKDLMIIW